MSKFYFDVQDEGISFADEEGTELVDVEAARIEGLRALAEMARDLLPERDDGGHISITIQTEQREPIYQLRLQLSVQRLGRS